MELTKINGKYELWLPKHRADRPEWKIENGGWEYNRIEAMLQCIKSTDVVFDIGVEEGDITALIAKYTACKMVLFEPNEKAWPCMKAIWEANNLPEPLDFFSGFVSNNNRGSFLRRAWSGIGDEIIGDHGFKQLYEQDEEIPQITIDDYCKNTRIYPTIITMDCEGSEMEIIKGAIDTLVNVKPIVFMSIHPEFMLQHYHQWTAHLFEAMKNCGYTWQLIDYDHELHVQFNPK